MDAANRTAGEETFQQSFLGASTIASQDFGGDATRYNSMRKYLPRYMCIVVE